MMSESDKALLYSSLTTRRSSYPTWILIKAKPFPAVIKRLYLGNQLTQVLLASDRAVAIPPVVDDIADSLTWLLRDAPSPLKSCYVCVLANLRWVCCDRNDKRHIPPHEAHARIAVIAMSRVVRETIPSMYFEALNYVRNFMVHTWGDRISFAGFQAILMDCYQFLLSLLNS